MSYDSSLNLPEFTKTFPLQGGRGGGGFKGGKTVVIEPHRHEGIFIARGKEDALVTLNLVPGSEVYGEKRISVEVRIEI